MKFLIVPAYLAAGSSAAALRRVGTNGACCFRITASGDHVDGVMGQFEDGQNRINGSYPPATYCYSNGGIVDANGRGCIVTLTDDATHQFQCDLNKPPTYGFTISDSGSIHYHGIDQFFACPYITEYNVYTQRLQGQDECQPIKLSTNATCAAGAKPSGTAATYYPTGASTTGVPAMSGYSSSPSQAPPYPSVSSSTQSVPGYGEYSTPAVYRTGAIPRVPSSGAPGYGAHSSVSVSVGIAYSKQTQPAPSVPIVPGYGRSSSIEAQSSQPATSGPQSSIPGYGSSSSQVSSPLYSNPVQTKPSTSYQHVPASTPVQSSAGQGTGTVKIPGYGASTPAESLPVESSTAAPRIPGHGASSTSVASSGCQTVTFYTTVSTSDCPETETQVSSGTMLTSIYRTQINSTPSSEVSTAVESFPIESSRLVSTFVTTAPALIPGYSGSSGPITYTSESTTCSEEITSVTTASTVPASTTGMVESTTCSEETSRVPTTLAIYSASSGHGSIPTPTWHD